MTGNSLAISNVGDLRQIAEIAAKSGFFMDSKSAEQAAMKILAGNEMNFGSFASLTGIHIIKGKPTVGANLMAAAILASPKYHYEVIEHTKDRCRIAFFSSKMVDHILEGKLKLAKKEMNKDEYLEYITALSNGVSTFTMDDAKQAGLTGNSNWKSYSANMLFARSISNGVRFFAPDLFSAPTYTPDELGALVNEDGDYVDTDFVEVKEPVAPEPKKPEPKPPEKPKPESKPKALTQKEIDKTEQETMEAEAKVIVEPDVEPEIQLKDFAEFTQALGGIFFGADYKKHKPEILSLAGLTGKPPTQFTLNHMTDYVVGMIQLYSTKSLPPVIEPDSIELQFDFLDPESPNVITVYRARVEELAKEVQDQIKSAVEAHFKRNVDDEDEAETESEVEEL